MKWGRFCGGNHRDYKSSDGKLSGVDKVAVFTVSVNAVMGNEVGSMQCQ